MMPHCKRDTQFELFDTAQHAATLAPRMELPFQRSKEIDFHRVRRIFGVGNGAVSRMLDLKLLRAYQVGGDHRGLRIDYDSVVEYCNHLRLHYRISEDRLLRKPERGRLRDEDLLPFPLAQTIYAREVARRLDTPRSNIRCLIEQGDLVGYQVLIDTKASPWRIFAPSLERYIASLHIQAQARLPERPRA